MKIMFASDIHGSAYYCKKMLAAFDGESADRLMLLGDILYHGPRNELPRDYDPKQVIEMLNAYKQKICAIRGNCDTEVDQMVLDFPMLADYCIIMDGPRMIYATHGHIFHQENLPPLNKGDILIHGHTHVPKASECEGIMILNPGSVSIPKENNPPSYAIMEFGNFVIKDFSRGIIKQRQL